MQCVPDRFPVGDIVLSVRVGTSGMIVDVSHLDCFCPVFVFQPVKRPDYRYRQKLCRENSDFILLDIAEQLQGNFARCISQSADERCPLDRADQV